MENITIVGYNKSIKYKKDLTRYPCIKKIIITITFKNLIRYHLHILGGTRYVLENNYRKLVDRALQ